MLLFCFWLISLFGICKKYFQRFLPFRGTFHAHSLFCHCYLRWILVCHFRFPLRYLGPHPEIEKPIKCCTLSNFVEHQLTYKNDIQYEAKFPVPPSKMHDHHHEPISPPPRAGVMSVMWTRNYISKPVPETFSWRIIRWIIISVISVIFCITAGKISTAERVMQHFQTIFTKLGDFISRIFCINIFMLSFLWVWVFSNTRARIRIFTS